MANLGNIGNALQVTALEAGARGQITLLKQPTHVTISITGGAPNTLTEAFSLGVIRIQDFTQSNSSGNATFYDWNDGVYYVQQIGTANAWVVTVTGSTVSVVRVSAGTRVSVFG